MVPCCPFPERGFRGSGARRRHSRRRGRSPMRSSSPGTRLPRQLFQVRGGPVQDPTEPPIPALPVSARAGRGADRFRARASGAAGVHPYSLPLASMSSAGSQPAPTFVCLPDTPSGKLDAETAPLARLAARRQLETGALVTRLMRSPGGRGIARPLSRGGAGDGCARRPVMLSAGAVKSAALLLRSAMAALPEKRNGQPLGPQVRRNFMNHNGSAVLAVDFFCIDLILSEDAGHQRFLLRRRRKAGRRLATPSFWARSPPPILKEQPALSTLARGSLLLARRAQRQLVPDERGSARARRAASRIDGRAIIARIGAARTWQAPTGAGRQAARDAVPGRLATRSC